MLTFKKFKGINNEEPTERLGTDELSQATNVDVGIDGEVRRRLGYTLATAGCHHNVWQADGFVLATINAEGDLANLDTNTVLHASVSHSPRMWYVNLPDGRTAYSNGLINGIVSSSARTTWGVPTPTSIGAAADTAGSLHPGDYRYQITHVRLTDGREGAPLYSAPITVSLGGISLSGLPILTGHKTNVYLTSHNGSSARLAGSTLTSTFSYTGKNDALVLDCMTDHLSPMPAGKLLAFWRGRALVAVGSVLYASKPFNQELVDLRRDFKQFPDDITLVQPVDGGVFVGTTTELAFLAGNEWDKLSYTRVIAGRVVLGSGVTAPGEFIKRAEVSGMPKFGDGVAMICIADGHIVAGFGDGGVVRMTQGRYRTTLTEVAATFRMRGDIPQYIAIGQ